MTTTLLFCEARTNRILSLHKIDSGFLAEVLYDNGGRYAKAFFSVEEANKWLDYNG